MLNQIPSGPLTLFGTLLGLLPTRAQTAVDTTLVIAVDISYSMDQDEQELQREGYPRRSAHLLSRRPLRMASRAGLPSRPWNGRGYEPAGGDSLDSAR
ncbi:DUF1194 domain-containing protein [Microvirga vignae]|uniref:DUF1194 domain-containing protein n=1 Tax=Microvirga vignae TaxID=1225564 RepID=UPI000B061E4C